MRIQFRVMCAILLVFAMSAFQLNAASLLTIVPDSSYLVVNFNLGRIMQQPDLKAAAQKMVSLKDDNFSNFYTRAGIDPIKDISNVMLFLNSGEKACIVVNGTFNTDKISELIQSDSEVAKKIKIEDMLGFQAVKNIANKSSNVVFVDKNTVAFGEVSILEDLLKVKNGTAKSLATNKSFASLMKKMDTRAGLWGAMLPSTDNWAKPQTNVVASTLKEIQSAFFSMNYGKFFTFNFTGQVEKAEQLAALESGLTNLLDAMRGWTAGSPEMLKLLKMAKVQAKGTLARVIMKVPADEFVNLMEKLGERAKAQTKN